MVKRPDSSKRCRTFLLFPGGGASKFVEACASRSRLQRAEFVEASGEDGDYDAEVGFAIDEEVWIRRSRFQ